MQDSAALRQEIEALKALADAGMDEHAPPANALAREKLLQLYRARQWATGHLDIESPLLTRTERRSAAASGNHDAIENMARDRLLPWCVRDFEALEWLCRLDAAGHAGAARLLTRTLDEARLRKDEREGLRFESLGAKFPKITLALARRSYRVQERNVAEETETKLDLVEIRLDLVKVCLGMGDRDGARELLLEVVEEGDEKQRQRARDLLDRM